MSELARGQKIAVGKEAPARGDVHPVGQGIPAEGARRLRRWASAGSPPAAASRRRRARPPWRASSQVLVKVAQTSSASIRMRSIAPAKADAKPRLEFPIRGAVAHAAARRFAGRARTRRRRPRSRSPSPARRTSRSPRRKVSGTSHRFPAKLQPDTEYAWTVSVAGAGDRRRPVPHAAGGGDPGRREAPPVGEGGVLRSPALRAAAAGNRRGAGGAGSLGQARPGAHRPSRARRASRSSPTRPGCQRPWRTSPVASSPASCSSRVRRACGGPGRVRFRHQGRSRHERRGPPAFPRRAPARHEARPRAGSAGAAVMYVVTRRGVLAQGPGRVRRHRGRA